MFSTCRIWGWGGEKTDFLGRENIRTSGQKWEEFGVLVGQFQLGTGSPARFSQSQGEEWGLLPTSPVPPKPPQAKLWSFLEYWISIFTREDKVCPTLLPETLCVETK